MNIVIATIILNFNGKIDTQNCLKSINKLIIPSNISHKIIVVDNNSTDGSVKFLKSIFPDLKIIKNPTNSGFTGGNNIGVNYAREISANWILLLNNDTIVNPNLLIELNKAILSQPKAVIFSPKIYFAPHHEFHQARYSEQERGKVIWYAGGKIDWDNLIISHRGVDEVDAGQFDSQMQIQVATGCAMLIHRKLWESQDLFDNRYYLYYEDTDLCLRARNYGEIWYIPSAYLWHINSGSSGSGSNLHDYFLTRNRLLLGQKYARLRTKIALIKESIKLLYSGRHFQKTGIRDFYLRRFGRGSYI